MELYETGAISKQETQGIELRFGTAEALVALLTPVAKAFFTDTGLESCVLGQQVFGGHGYIREWGQEQLVRDVRIAQLASAELDLWLLEGASASVTMAGGLGGTIAEGDAGTTPAP